LSIIVLPLSIIVLHLSIIVLPLSITVLPLSIIVLHLTIIVSPLSSIVCFLSSSCAFRHSCYGIYTQFYLPYRAELAAPSQGALSSVFSQTSWFVILAGCIVLSNSQLCVCILLEKRHHLKRTGRKFYTVDRASE